MESQGARVSALSDALARLWTEHVVWTRQVIVSTLAHLADAPTASARLFRNQHDIGAALGKFYGSGFATAATNLLTQHIQIADALVVAAAAGNAGEVARLDSAWHDNAVQIARALASVNHNWTEADLQQMLFQHLALTKAEATARIERRWSDDVAAFDSVLAQALGMARTMADGIEKQFPGS
jgi:hypothetical protein